MKKKYIVDCIWKKLRVFRSCQPTAINYFMCEKKSGVKYPSNTRDKNGQKNR